MARAASWRLGGACAYTTCGLSAGRAARLVNSPAALRQSSTAGRFRRFQAPLNGCFRLADRPYFRGRSARRRRLRTGAVLQIRKPCSEPAWSVEVRSPVVDESCDPLLFADVEKRGKARPIRAARESCFLNQAGRRDAIVDLAEVALYLLEIAEVLVDAGTVTGREEFQGIAQPLAVQSKFVKRESVRGRSDGCASGFEKPCRQPWQNACGVFRAGGGNLPAGFPAAARHQLRPSLPRQRIENFRMLPRRNSCCHIRACRRRFLERDLTNNDPGSIPASAASSSAMS